MDYEDEQEKPLPKPKKCMFRDALTGKCDADARHFRRAVAQVPDPVSGKKKRTEVVVGACDQHQRAMGQHRFVEGEGPDKSSFVADPLKGKK